MKKILVADDSLGWRNYHKRMLFELSDDFSVDICEWAREAYEKVYENINSPYDLIITDLQMESDFSPQYAGEWLTERIRELASYNKTPVLMVSATYNIELIANQHGADFLPKSTAANNLVAYELKIKELLKL